MALCDLMKHLLLGGIYFLCGSLDSYTHEGLIQNLIMIFSKMAFLFQVYSQVSYFKAIHQITDFEMSSKNGKIWRF